MKPSFADEQDLRLYFDLGVDHFAPPSNFGVQLELAERFWGELIPCVGCGGVEAESFVTDDGEEIFTKNERAGSGFVTDGRAWRKTKNLARLLGSELPPPEDLICPTCEGHGWVRCAARRKKPTVQRTGQTPPSIPADPFSLIERMDRFGRVDRILYRLRPADPTAYAALATYYGPSGSLAALWCLTTAGKEMLRECSLAVTEAAFFKILRDRQTKSFDAERARQFAEADVQARLLLEEAWVQWNRWARWKRAG